MASPTLFTDPKTCIIFTYAPAGLGHLRVTDALRHGLPLHAQAILLPESSKSIRWIHRLTSRNPLGKRLMEWAQYGKAEDVVTRIYRKMLRRDSAYLEEEILKILKQRIQLPERLLVVASHFGLAHQLSVVKKNIENKARVKITIVMQVTDDSPQKIWYVPGIDLITVPSEMTKQTLLRYAKSEGLEPSKLVVLPYPVSPHLCEKLLPAALKHRKQQCTPASTVPINVCVPVSGAAVGTMYAQNLLRELLAQEKRFLFHIVSKKTFYTEMFLQSLAKKSAYEISASHSDRQIVELYEQLYDRVVLSMEITKPSEQAFKALLSPEQTGGVILLFTEPVGRQEYDNLAFLERHGLIPTALEQQELWDWSSRNWTLTEHEKKRLFASTDHWRGLRLPADASRASRFVLWAHQEGVFRLMQDAAVCSRGDVLCREEVSGEGVKLFWKEVEKLVARD